MSPRKFTEGCDISSFRPRKGSSLQHIEGKKNKKKYIYIFQLLKLEGETLFFTLFHDAIILDTVPKKDIIPKTKKIKGQYLSANIVSSLPHNNNTKC